MGSLCWLCPKFSTTHWRYIIYSYGLRNAVGWVTFKWKQTHLNFVSFGIWTQHFSQLWDQRWRVTPGVQTGNCSPIRLKPMNADLSKPLTCTNSTRLVLLVGEVNPQHAHSSKYKLHRGQQVVQHGRLWDKWRGTCCYWPMQLRREDNKVWRLVP